MDQGSLRQRKRQRLDAQRTAQPLPPLSDSERELTPAEEDMVTERLWAEWESAQATPEELAQIKVEREILAIVQKEDPSIGHVWVNPTPPLPPEEREEMHRKLREAINQRK